MNLSNLRKNLADNVQTENEKLKLEIAILKHEARKAWSIDQDQEIEDLKMTILGLEMEMKILKRENELLAQGEYGKVIENLKIELEGMKHEMQKLRQEGWK